MSYFNVDWLRIKKNVFVQTAGDMPCIKLQ